MQEEEEDIGEEEEIEEVEKVKETEDVNETEEAEELCVLTTLNDKVTELESGTTRPVTSCAPPRTGDWPYMFHLLKGNGQGRRCLPCPV